MLIEPLTPVEKADYEQKLRRLKEIEGSWFEAGQALAEIRDRRLYRGHHATFEAFCKAELGMAKSNYNRRVQSSHVAQLLATNVAKPEREAHVRPLLSLTAADTQIEAFKNAVNQARHDGKPLTAALVTRAVREMQRAQRGPEEPTPPQLPTKADLITRLSRAITRDLEQLSEDQINAFETACLEFKHGWLAKQPPPDVAGEAGA